MSIIRLQGEEERRRGVHYDVDMSLPAIGEGGMGVVRKGVCVDERTGSTRPVAIKFMFADMPAQVIERARREASIQLRNDNLIEMLGFIEVDEPQPNGQVIKRYHVVSELLNGISLDDLLEGKTKDRSGEDIPFAVKMLQDYKNDPDHFAQTIIMNVLSGLMALHDAGYIHRDIDPSNIMITADGHIKLIDFGIAKQMNNLTTSDKQLTVAGKFMGKPEYAAPELALGDVKHQNQTTDIYAMGILLYQCIIGHTPFEGARADILQKQLNEKLPLNVVKNKALRGIIATACEKKQDMRYQSAAQMRVALETMNGKGVKGSGGGSKKMGIIIGAAAAVVVALVVILLMVKSSNDKAQAEAEAAAAAQQFELDKQAFKQGIESQLQGIEKIKVADVDANDYVSSLMQTYKALVQVEQQLAADTVYHLSMPEVATKTQAAKKDLQDCATSLADKISQFEEADMSEEAEPYRVELVNLHNFMRENNIEIPEAAPTEEDNNNE